LLSFLLLAYFRSISAQQNSTKINIDFEADVLPYATGGYFGDAWARKNKWRERLLTAKVNKPVMCHPIETFCTYTSTHDFASRPNAIFSTWQGTQNTDTKPTLPRAKNVNAQPTHPS
jgi:hypothetical protein